jgi:hypothetical protein
MKHFYTSLFISILFNFSNASAQDTLKVLFLGNSYTFYNNLPQLVVNLSASAGKTVIVDSNTPGGFPLSGHSTDATSLNKIRQGVWDYVILQEQSQIPTIDFYRYNDMYPAIQRLKDTIERYNPCGKIINYMTWGRRFGGQQCDPSNTYCSPNFANFNEMQDSLTSAYIGISDIINAQCAPVGEAWRRILNDTSIVLHSGDNSHPLLEGSYVAACVLYSSLWKSSSLGLTYNAGLSTALATYFQKAADSTLFNNNLNWNLLINQPIADFSFVVNGNSVQFENASSSLNLLNYSWNFGDGNTSNSQNPQHTYASFGEYDVTLIASYCNFFDTVQYSLNLNSTGLDQFEVRNDEIIVFPNPANDYLTFNWKGKNKMDVTFINSLGQNVKVIDLNKLNKTIDLKDLEKGIYFLIINNSYKTVIRKLVINN